MIEYDSIPKKEATVQTCGQVRKDPTGRHRKPWQAVALCTPWGEICIDPHQASKVRLQSGHQAAESIMPPCLWHSQVTHGAGILTYKTGS